MRCAIGSAAAGLVALLITGLHAAPAAGTITVEIGTVTARPGAMADVPVTVHTDGEPLHAFQNDLLFDAAISPLRRDGWRASCTQNPDLLPGDLGVRWSVLEYPCDASSCIRATAGASSETFPPGPVDVYSCTVQVAPDAAAGAHPVRCAAFDTTTPGGESLGGTCTDGAIIVAGDPVDATPIAFPTPTAPPASAGPPRVIVGDVRGNRGDRVPVELRLRSGAMPIVGLQADLIFAASARIAARANGKPDCRFGDAPSFAGFSSLSFQPPGCGVDDCTAIRAILLTTDIVPIPDGAVLLTCSVDLAAGAPPGVSAFALSNLRAATHQGMPEPLAGEPGTITIDGAPLATPVDPDAGEGTATPTATGIVLTPAIGQGERPVSNGAAASASSGCAIAPPHAASPGWEILAIVALLILRRHTRARSR
jgi:hypothetical protein